MGRSKFVTATPKKVVQHGEFIDRIRKTLYYGVGTMDSDMEMSRPLAEYAADLFSEPHRGHSLNRLTCVTAGKMHATPCSLIMALIYLDRLNIMDPGYARRITPQELFVVSLMISTKFYAGHDERFYLEDWAKEGHMSQEKLKQMELDFLTAIDWNIYISNEQFFEKLSGVERTLAEREGLRRGWLTYGELMQLLPSFTLMKFLLNNVAVLALSYAASVITIAGAFFIASQVPGTLWHRRAATTTTTQVTTTATVDTPMPQPNATQAAPVGEASTNIVLNDNNNNNDSCSALNVEAELLMLEQQYCAEARLNELQRMRQKNPPQQQLLLPSNYRSVTHPPQNNAQHWLSIKSEYSDDNPQQALLLQFGHNLMTTPPQNVSVFWQLLSEMMQQSFLVRWPELWPKLI